MKPIKKMVIYYHTARNALVARNVTSTFFITAPACFVSATLDRNVPRTEKLCQQYSTAMLFQARIAMMQ